MKTVAFMPYYAGHTTGPAAPDKRPDYLKRTIESLAGFADVIWVGVNRSEDEYNAARAGDCIVARMDCPPLHIAYELVKMAQKDGFTDGYDYVYVTEADQVMHLDRELLKFVEDDTYLVPHRLEELGPGRAGAARGPLFEFEGREWVTGERPPVPEVSQPVYRTAHIVDGYGGAYLCGAQFFRELHFNLDPKFTVETVTGFTPFYAGRTLKATDWKRFFVEHLSGYDYHCKLAEG